MCEKSLRDVAPVEREGLHVWVPPIGLAEGLRTGEAASADQQFDPVEIAQQLCEATAEDAVTAKNQDSHWPLTHGDRRDGGPRSSQDPIPVFRRRHTTAVTPAELAVAVVCDRALSGITDEGRDDPQQPDEAPGETEELVYAEDGVAVATYLGPSMSRRLTGSSGSLSWCR